ncbi:N-acetylneuraminate 9-O-acetyltransferase-like [Macrobrachium rosenbergii]|uniref:N-acetylneuraminate 9-O-acetyltransferase-like n=1 Tax=Macrobrachium rosenbergii TaxID=79674 RepID=UPI0034D549FF
MKEVSECVWDLWEVVRNKSQPNPWKGPGSSSSSASSSSDVVAISKRPSVHFVFVGDSHVRNLFEAFFKRIVSRRMKYHSSGMKENEWKNPNYHKVFWKNKKPGNYHKLLHLDIPLKATFYWDPRLILLPEYLSSWMSGKASKPTYLITAGTALHFMAVTSSIYLTKGIEASSVPFIDCLKKLSPLLAEFSKTTPVVFKLQDHLKRHRSNRFRDQRTVDRYNQISYELLPRSSNFIIWNSTIPMSDIYWQGCSQLGSEIRRSENWRCQNFQHLGFVVFHQFIDMFLNGICCCFKNKW